MLASALFNSVYVFVYNLQLEPFRAHVYTFRMTKKLCPAARHDVIPIHSLAVCEQRTPSTWLLLVLMGGPLKSLTDCLFKRLEVNIFPVSH